MRLLRAWALRLHWTSSSSSGGDTEGMREIWFLVLQHLRLRLVFSLCEGYVLLIPIGKNMRLYWSLAWRTAKGDAPPPPCWKGRTNSDLAQTYFKACTVNWKTNKWTLLWGNWKYCCLKKNKKTLPLAFCKKSWFFLLTLLFSFLCQNYQRYNISTKQGNLWWLKFFGGA